MNRITQALRDLFLTAHDFVIPTEPAPVRRPLRPMVPPEHDVFAAVAHPDPDRSTEATVQGWLDAVAPTVPADGCRHCDRTPQEHGLLPVESPVAYAALVGEHTWTEPHMAQTTQRSTARDRAQGAA